MSKKQREKVEDEVRYHKEINRQAGEAAAAGLALNGSSGGGSGQQGSGTSPDSSVFDPPQPSSTEHMYGGYVIRNYLPSDHCTKRKFFNLIIDYLFLFLGFPIVVTSRRRTTPPTRFPTWPMPRPSRQRLQLPTTHPCQVQAEQVR
jgi:hypothetical protein